MDDISIFPPEEMQRREELKQRILTEFQEDMLFRILSDRDWVEDLFDDQLLSIKVGYTYSIPEAADILSLNSPQDIRNIFRSLRHYVRPDDTSGTIRLDYKAIFRLKMIFYLKREFTIPALERLLSGLPVEHDDEIIMPDVMKRLLLETERKSDMMFDMMKSINQKLENQALLLQSGAEKEKALSEEIQLLKQNQELLLEKLNKSYELQSKQLQDLFKNLHSDEEWDQVKELVSQMRDREDRDQQLMAAIRSLQGERIEKKGFWRKLFS